MIKYIERDIQPDEYNYLRKSVGWNEFDIKSIGSSLAMSLYSILVLDDNKIVGMGRIIGDEKLDFYIKDIIVIPEYQGKKIGKGIMEKIMLYVNENAIDYTTVSLMSAIGKEGFYKKYGFIERPNKTQGFGMNITIRKPKDC